METLGGYQLARLVRRTRSFETFEGAADGRPRVLIKRVIPDLGRVKPLELRLLSEARAYSVLKHPAILELKECAAASDGSPYQVFAFFDGEDLFALKERAGKQDAAFSADVALHVFLEVAAALSYAHKAGIAHGSLSPRSVLLSASGDVKVTDFRAGSGDDLEAIGFAAPGSGEATGQSSGIDDDIYLAGRLLRWLYTALVVPDRSEIERRVRSGKFDLSASILDTEVELIVVKATHASKDNRHASIDELIAECTHIHRQRSSDVDPKDAIRRFIASLKRLPPPAETRIRPTKKPKPPEEAETSFSNRALVAEVKRSWQTNTNRVGKTIDGRYQLAEIIGEGGMGTVYRAVQLNVGRDVALKTLHTHSESMHFQDLVVRFENEAKVISQLRHPNTVKLFDFGRIDEDELYIVTELLFGETLEEEIESGRLDESETLRIISEAADALTEAHQKGIIHRDIKPRNIFLDRVGDRRLVKLLDFGLAKFSGHPTRTAAGVAVGSPSYMSPEQALGEDVTPKSDLYSLGVTAYECLSGELPFKGNNVAAVLLKHVHDAPAPFRELAAPLAIDPEVEALVMSLLAKAPKDRPESASAVRQRVERIQRRLIRSTGTAVHESPTEFTPPPKTPVPMARPLTGSVLGSYRVREIVGNGPLSAVYRATHVESGADFAIKVLSDAAIHRATIIKRLEREAEALGRLDHPNIVKVVELGATKDSSPYLVMEFLHGRTLRQTLADDGPFSPEAAAFITAQVASGLALAHRQGFVHRDLKPGNIMLIDEPGGPKAKILDFGLTRLLDKPPGGSGITKKDALLGSPGYMAPEQIENASGAGPAADLYALGCVLYAMLLSHPPFAGTLLEILEQQLTRRPAPLPESGGLERLALQLLEKHPKDRPQSGDDVVAELARLGFEIGAVGSLKRAQPDRGAERISAPVDVVSVPMIIPAPAGEMRSSQPTGSITLQRPQKPPRQIWFAVFSSVIVALGFLVTYALMTGAPGPAGHEVRGPVGETVRIVEDRPPEAPRVEPKIEEKPERAVEERLEPERRYKVTNPPGPSSRRPRRSEEKQAASSDLSALSALDGKLRKALQGRGLAMADLDNVPAVAEPLADFRSAKRAHDVQAAESALNLLLTRLGGVQMDGRIVQAKLDRVARELRSAKDSVPSDALHQLEKRYFDLGSQLARATSAAQFSDLAGEIETLERDISSARRN